MIVLVRRATIGLAMSVALVLTGCSSSAGKPDGSSSAPSSTRATSAVGTSPAPPPVVPSGTGTPADAATKAAAGSAYTTFFDPKTSAAATEAVLQHGGSFKAVLATEAASSQAQGVSATVGTVNLISTDLAYVTFTLVSGGSPLLTDTPGYAVREGGTWKVAAQTFCNLLQLQGTAPAVCKDASITALPS